MANQHIVRTLGIDREKVLREKRFSYRSDAMELFAEEIEKWDAYRVELHSNWEGTGFKRQVVYDAVAIP